MTRYSENSVYDEVWPESARAELRAVDREIAIRILRALTEYGVSGVGDVKALAGEWQGYFRIRIGDYRVSSRSRRMKLRLSEPAIGRTSIAEVLPLWNATGYRDCIGYRGHRDYGRMTGKIISEAPSVEALMASIAAVKKR